MDFHTAMELVVHKHR